MLIYLGVDRSFVLRREDFTEKDTFDTLMIALGIEEIPESYTHATIRAKTVNLKTSA